MSQKTIQLVIGRILTDESLREEFLICPEGVLRDLRNLGHEITDIEMHALIDTDPRIWTATAKRIHPRLQRCRTTG